MKTEAQWIALKRIAMLGVAQVLLGCFVGFIPPTAVLHFRSIVTAHIEFCINGILLAVLGILTQYMDLSPGMLFLPEINAYLGTFCGMINRTVKSQIYIYIYIYLHGVCGEAISPLM
jgi:hypothetical protein